MRLSGQCTQPKAHPPPDSLVCPHPPVARAASGSTDRAWARPRSRRRSSRGGSWAPGGRGGRGWGCRTSFSSDVRGSGTQDERGRDGDGCCGSACRRIAAVVVARLQVAVGKGVAASRPVPGMWLFAGFPGGGGNIFETWQDVPKFPVVMVDTTLAGNTIRQDGLERLGHRDPCFRGVFSCPRSDSPPLELHSGPTKHLRELQ